MPVWCCWVTRTNWRRWRPVPCWAICVATPKLAGIAHTLDNGCKPSVAKAWQDSGLQEDTQGTHPLAQQVVMLRHSRRFGEGSGIGQLARWVNQQQPAQARKLLAARSHDDVFASSLQQ